MDKLDFKTFKKKALVENDELFTVLTLDPVSTRLTYLIYKWNINITPNQISFFRLIFLAPLALILFFVAAISKNTLFYMVSVFVIYFVLLSDDMDGHLARGAKKGSEFGAFLDTISDRMLILLTFGFILSLGFFLNNPLLIYGGVLLLVLKIFNLTVISKIFYYGKRGMESDALFSGEKEIKVLQIDKIRKSFFSIHKIIRIPRWGGNFGGVERIVLTVMLPCLLLYLGFERIPLYESYILVVLFSYFYLSRTIGLIRDYKKTLDPN